MKDLFISLAFDDGWKSAIEQASPLLMRHGIPATFYIISDRIGDDYPEYMDANDLKTLHAAGHELGVHTRSHKHLSELSDKEIRYEITEGLNDLHELGFNPRTFAYPYGDWNPQVVKQVREAGFLAARSIERGINDERTNPFLLRAEAVREEHSAEQIIAIIAEAMKTVGWLILYFHQIESADVLRKREWIYGSTPEILDKILSFIKQKEIPVMTVEKGMEKLSEFTSRATKV